MEVMKIRVAKQTGFTIVELLIVVVVIAILAAITIVAYTGIQNRTKSAAVDTTLKQAATKIESSAVLNAGVYPDSLATAGFSGSDSKVALQYTRSADTKSYCVTVVYGGSEYPKSKNGSEAMVEGPCSGHSGGPNWCPVNALTPINGFYCDGTIGSNATLNSAGSGLVRLNASDAEVPTDAPGAYVGRQTSRDNLIGAQLTVSPGEVYCFDGWAATTSSTVSHALGFQYYNGTASSWTAAGRVYPNVSGWQKMSNCLTVPAGIIRATVWTQNDGTSGTTAAAPWYQTALKVWKQ